MKVLAVDAGTTLASLSPHLVPGSGPLLLDLDGAPEADGAEVDVLHALAAFDGLLFARFSGTLRTPLVEIALLALESVFPGSARLDLRGARLSPLVSRLGGREALRLLARHGPVVPASRVLRRAVLDGTRSPLALRSAAELLSLATGSSGAALAAELARFRLAMTSDDRLEGVQAFRQRRPPRFDW